MRRLSALLVIELVGSYELHFLRSSCGGLSMQKGIARGAFSAGLTVLGIAAFASSSAHCVAADLPSAEPSAVEYSKPASGPNSILVFGGRMSTTDIYTTTLFNLTAHSTGPNYDNYIVGAAFDHDLLNLGHGFYFGVEVGIADRYGNYKQCCRPVIMSNSIVESGELWAGPQVRYAGILLFNVVRIGGSVTIGLSAATASIGRELQREVNDPGNARLLYYLGPELDFSTPSIPNLEFVIRLQHRSGGADVPIIPTIGNMAEGYNANVAGIRYRF